MTAAKTTPGIVERHSRSCPLGEAAAETLAAKYRVAPATVRQWTSKARARGLAPKEV
jgi:hypothetical protein